MIPRTSAYRVFWFGRYLERAEENARLVRLALAGKITWGDVLASLSLTEAFDKTGAKISGEAAARFLVFDRDNPSSVAHAIWMARENANGTVPDAVYCALNRLHLHIAETDFDADRLEDFLADLVGKIRAIENAVEEAWS